jgi:hypothetical protein
MPCALTEPENYPDYLKTILKTIEFGNDDKLKTCACLLKSPVNGDGCIALDENQKIGAFPACMYPIDNNSTISLKTLMEMYWTVKTWRLNFNGTASCPAGFGQNYAYSFSDALIEPIIYTPYLNDQCCPYEQAQDKKELVCGATFRYYGPSAESTTFGIFPSAFNENINIVFDYNNNFLPYYDGIYGIGETNLNMGAPNEDGPFNLKIIIGDHSYSIPMQSQGSEGYYCITSINAKLTATSFW